MKKRIEVEDLNLGIPEASRRKRFSSWLHDLDLDFPLLEAGLFILSVTLLLFLLRSLFS